MDRPLYKIRGWEETFEVAQSRKQPKEMSWVPMPTRMDGKRYRKIASQPDGAAILGCWLCMVELAARRPKERRGFLEDSDGPLSSADMAVATGLSVEAFERALNVLSSKGIEWLILETVGEPYQTPPTATGCGGLQDRTRQNKTEQDKTAVFQVDVTRFRAEYPSECSDWDVQLLLSEIRAQADQDKLFANLALYRETDRWRGGFHPSAENFLRKGIWKVAPKAPAVKSAASRSRLGASVERLLSGNR